MGAWDAGSFDNDKALDWVFDVCRSKDITIVRNALRAAIEVLPPPKVSLFGKLFRKPDTRPALHDDVACEALAAAEIIAFWLGYPAADFPDDLSEWARQQAASFSPDLTDLARQAVLSVKTKSELKDLWEEGNSNVALDWYDAVADLEKRLGKPGN